MSRAYIFDLDDTLINTIATKTEAIQFVAKKYYNTDISSERIRAVWGKPFHDLMEELAPKHAKIEELIEQYKAEREKFPSYAYPNTIETLTTLSKRAMLGIVTSHTRIFIHSDLEAAHIPEELFTIILTAEDTQFHKPDPRVFDKVIELCVSRSIEKNDMMYIGDSLMDYQAAHDAGIPFIGIHSHTAPKETFENLGIQTIGDIKELLII